MYRSICTHSPSFTMFIGVTHGKRTDGCIARSCMDCVMLPISHLSKCMKREYISARNDTAFIHWDEHIGCRSLLCERVHLDINLAKFKKHRIKPTMVKFLFRIDGPIVLEVYVPGEPMFRVWPNEPVD